jgi:hypothetical protein
MKKLILAAFVMCLAGGVYAANQQCFYGKNCADGKLVSERSHQDRRVHKHRGFVKHGHKMHKHRGVKAAACPCKEEGKPCACKTEIKENQEGCSNCKAKGKPCACAQDKHCGCKDKKQDHNAQQTRGKDKK